MVKIKICTFILFFTGEIPHVVSFGVICKEQEINSLDIEKKKRVNIHVYNISIFSA